jgi:hypothetical protein
MESLAIDYTVGGGANRAEHQELIIYSWDRDAEPAGLFCPFNRSVLARRVTARQNGLSTSPCASGGP